MLVQEIDNRQRYYSKKLNDDGGMKDYQIFAKLSLRMKSFFEIIFLWSKPNGIEKTPSGGADSERYR